jgi:hypothetical protein
MIMTKLRQFDPCEKCGDETYPTYKEDIYPKQEYFVVTCYRCGATRVEDVVPLVEKETITYMGGETAILETPNFGVQRGR